MEHEHAFSELDVRLLETIANSMSVALENARLFDETQRLLKETEERNAELAVINSVQQALAAELDMQGIYDAVGDKIREIFDAQGVFIGTLDHESRLGIFNYFYEMGERFHPGPVPFSGMMEHIAKTGEMVVINANMAEESETYGLHIPAGIAPKSGVWMPIKSGGRTQGIVSLQNLDREHAFSDSDIRLLQTLANAMSVSLENARLFDETQRLLKITEDRAAELAVINSIQQGLAAELNFQSIIDLVGDKLRDVLRTDEIGIRWYDAKTNLNHYLYEFEHGQRLTIPPGPPLKGGIFEKILETRQPFFRNTVAEREALGITVVPGTDPSKSSVNVPIIGSDRVVGSIIVEDYEKEYAFSDSDVRLLTTVAASMGVALENARLFDETQRLLKETEERNAELAVINSVQASLAAKLEMQAIFDAVGDKIQEIFDAQVVMIVTHDKANDLAQFSYAIEKGERFNINPRPVAGITGYVIRTGKTVMITQDLAQREIEILGAAIIPVGDDIEIAASMCR